MLRPYNRATIHMVRTRKMKDPGLPSIEGNPGSEMLVTQLGTGNCKRPVREQLKECSSGRK